MHPMIEALGEKKYREMLESFPEHYNEQYKGNYKPVSMMTVWLMKDGTYQDLSEPETRDVLTNAYTLWIDGHHLANACIRSLAPFKTEEQAQ